MAFFVSDPPPQPERVVLGVRAGEVPSTKPPVRLFLGTAPAQHRAERVFLWSVEQHRDASRVYEIYLMKDLAFAIPHFAGGAGRAIYNRIDQIYLADPGELFDTELDDHGFLALSDRDTSVMLLDCARMSAVWTLEAAQTIRRKTLQAQAGAIPGLWGPLEAAWHVHDTAYVPGGAKLLHYSTSHRRPWRLSPPRYANQRHPVAQVWFDLERAADAAGYQVFSAQRPSARYRALLARLRKARGQGDDKHRQVTRSKPDAEVDRLQALITAAAAGSLLVCGLGCQAATAEGLEKWPAGACEPVVTRYDLAALSAAERSSERFDGVVCTQVLEYVPDADVPWVLKALFARARRFVFVMISSHPSTLSLANGTHLRKHLRDRAWWLAHLEAASARDRQVHWQLIIKTRHALGHEDEYLRAGGCRLTGPPTVWVLTDGHPGNTTQSIGLVRAMGWPYDVKALRFTPLVQLHDALFGAFGASRLGLHKARSAALAAPWPDIVVNTGWRTAHVARWIRKQSRGHTRLVQLGRGGGQVAGLFDAVVTCTYFRLPPHPRRIETVAPLTQVTPELLAPAAEHWQALFEAAPHPRIALLVGGTSGLYRLEAETARCMGEAIRTLVQAAGGSLFVTTSRRTGAPASAALKRELEGIGYVHQWQPDQRENPYLGYLALADVLVVTGDSESMLAESVATGKPVYIYPLPGRPPGLRTRLREWVVAHAQQPQWPPRGWPQQRLGDVCAWLIERGMILPPNDLHTLHQTLIQRGVARFVGEPFETATRHGLQEVKQVAGRVRELVGIYDGTGSQ